MSDQPVEIPLESLTPEALHGVLEEIVSRDGTEFTAVSAKLERLHSELKAGRARLYFDPESESCAVLPVRPGDMGRRPAD